MPKKEYTVVGPTPFRGNAPGSSFSAELTEAQEARAIARGSIVLGGRKEKESLEEKSRSELDAIASGLGVEEPEKLENKAAVISAIRDKKE